MNSAGHPLRILIVDDHPLVREGLALRISLEGDLAVCGEADSQDAAQVRIEDLEPDLVLVDLSLKSGHGLELIKWIKSRRNPPRVLVVSAFQESLYAERALRSGAQGYLNKQESGEKLIEAIRTVAAGERYLSEDMRRRLIDQALGGADAEQSPMERLTDRELEIFRMIGDGLTSGTIAKRLFLSPHTIDTHRENIKRKLGLTTAGELSRAAVKWALENG